MQATTGLTRLGWLWRFGTICGLVTLAAGPFCAWSLQKTSTGTWRRAPATTDRMTQRIETGALKLQSGTPLARVALSDTAYPRDQAQYTGLDGNAVILITALTQDAAELPLARVSVVAGDKSTDLTRVYSVLSDQTESGSQSVKAFGPYREDVLCLLPIRLRMQPSDVVADFAGNGGRVKLMTFGATIPPQISSVVAASTLGNGPSEEVLDAFIRREFPGVLDPPRKRRRSAAQGSELNGIATRGKQIARYDVAAWHATDAVKALEPKPGGTTHYVATEAGGRWRVVFGRLDETRSKFLAEYEATEGSGATEFTAKKLDPPREETGFVLSCARAIDTARADFGPRDRPYNVAVVPASSGQMYVYVLPAQTDVGIYPLGGDVRYLIAPDGITIIEKREMHRAIIEFKSPPSGKVETSFHTAVLDDIPEDTDVFHVLARSPSVPELVLTPEYVYQVKADGTIWYVGTTGAFMKTLNQTK